MKDNVTELLTQIEAFLAESGIAPSAFGRDAMGDPLFVFQLRAGREPRRATRELATQQIKRHLDGSGFAQPSKLRNPPRGEGARLARGDNSAGGLP
jgi:hypothetical protein